VLRAGEVLEREYMDRPTVELELDSAQLEAGGENFLSNTKLKGVAAKPSTPYGSTKRRRPRKRLRLEQ
jgi:hypothetical protein